MRCDPGTVVHVVTLSFISILVQLLPSSPSVHLSLVGPEISTSANIKLSDNLSAMCHSSEYLSWREKGQTPPPNLALCFNSGLGTDITM
jgi:hypothetical protein